jgi:hypothetical protein
MQYHLEKMAGFNIFIMFMLKGKITLHSPFLEATMVFFLGESNIVALYSNIFEKLGKSEMKN